jgi:DNA-binding NtrC family response regulator
MKQMEEARIAMWIGAGWNLSAVENSLQRLGCRVERVNTFAGLWFLMERELDLVVVNCRSALEVLHWMKGVKLAGSSAPPVLTVATSHEVDDYLRAMSLGAFDCVAMPVQEKELRRLICRAMEERRAEPLLLHA